MPIKFLNGGGIFKIGAQSGGGVSVSSGGDNYAQQIAAIPNLLIWPMNEASGAVALESTLTQGNILPNPGFEILGAGGADVFGSWSETAGGGAIVDETSLVHSGGHALKLTWATGDALIQQSVTVVAGTVFTLKFWTRGDGTKNVRYRVNNNTAGTPIIDYTDSGITGTSYQQYTTSFTVPVGCVSIAVIFRIAGGAGAVYVDDVELIPDASIKPFSGAYTSCTLDQAGLHGKSVAFDGTASKLNLYSVALANFFTVTEWSVGLWAKASAAGDWSDSTLRYLFRFGIDDNNYVAGYKDNNYSDKLWLLVVSGGTSYAVATPMNSTTDWFRVDVTLSKSNNRIRLYINGNQIGNDFTGVADWSGVLSSSRCWIGSSSTSASFWKGNIQNITAANRELTAAEILTLASGRVTTADVAAFFGDSVTAGTGASDAAHRWVNIVAAANGYTYWRNSGQGGSSLQNTTQNTVAVIGGAAANNGRDVVAVQVTQYYPDHVYILYGLNDIRLNDAAFTVENFQNDLGEVVDLIIASGCPAANIVIGSPPYIPESSYASGAPYNGGSLIKHAAYVAAAAAVATAKSTGYVDIYQYMADNGGDTLISGDGIHPNDAGHAAIAAAFLA